MLTKMGWAGGGLGKDGGGLANLDQLWNLKKQGLKKGLGSAAEKRTNDKVKRKARKKRKTESAGMQASGESSLAMAYRQIEDLKAALVARDKWIQSLQRRLETRPR